MSNTISNTNSPNPLQHIDQLNEAESTNATGSKKATQAARQGNAADINDLGISKDGNSPTLAAPSNTVAKDISGLLNKLPGDGDNAAVDMFAVMSLMHKMSTENRKADREDRLNRMDEMVTAMESKVENLRKAANKAFEAAAIQGAVQIGSGLIQMGAAGMAMKASNTSASYADQATAATKNGMTKTAEFFSKAATAASTKAQSINQAGSALGNVAGGIGQIAAAGSTRESEMAKADAEADQGHSDVSRQQMDNLREAEQAWRDMMKDIRSQLEQQIQQDSQTRRNILQI
ncbi:hypothetical protein [Thalassospira sp.]|uniref:hypothetical protein n=1 Tax=Thalassospira sp. TaxID=1912094 RepID=UPI000C62B8F1|nr:hypothetical protein [Thalassospira sp.]MBC05420.1 hypothetical protein [Thalassospira sp.]|tara:strand:- start:18006 stop:18875 length:870 start_codon:yes stop_codon:yes gene_type:complete